MTLAQTQAVIARSGMTGDRQPEYGGGNLRLHYDYPTAVYVTILTLDFTFPMFNTQNVSRVSAGSSHPVGFYYDFTDYSGPPQANVDMYFTWLAGSKDWTDEVYSGRFVLEIAPR